MAKGRAQIIFQQAYPALANFFPRGVPIKNMHNQVIESSSTTQVPAAMLALLILSSLILFSCADLASQFSGYHERSYQGAALPLDQVAVLFGQHSAGRGYFVDIRGINGLPKKRLTMIELLPGTYDLCLTFNVGPADQCEHHSLEAKAGHTYLTDAVINKDMKKGYLLLIRDVIDEKSIRKQKVDEYVKQHRPE